MELVRGLYNLQPRHRGCVATIGNFDGLHLGHQRMLQAVRVRAKELAVPAAVISFEPLPREYLATGAVPPRLMRFREKFAALADCGIDRFVCLRFDERMKRVSPEEFIERILIDQLQVKWIVAGEDFRFARNRQGEIATLRSHGLTHGYGVDVIEPLVLDGERVSSSLVRAALASGDMERARRLLGRSYRMSGKVVEGQLLGRKLGFPTANVRLLRRSTALAGVFAVRVSGAGLNRAPGVANLGTRPAIEGHHEPLLEAHVFDFSGNLYRQMLHVDFEVRLRDEVWFPSLEALTEQIRADAVQARQILGVTA
jgi:riboflavin kinase/FMN adenylyltransferase